MGDSAYQFGPLRRQPDVLLRRQRRPFCVSLVDRVSAFLAGLGLLCCAAATASAQSEPSYPTTVFEGDARVALISVDDLVVEISLEAIPDLDPYFDTPVLRIQDAGQLVMELPGVASGFDFPATEASIAEIDPANDGPDVFFASYSGGAHCCTQVVVATRTPRGWTAVPLGEFDGDGGQLTDLDGDGFAEVATFDNRFLYRFGCYACSAAPLIIMGVREGRMVDMSADPVFMDAHREWLVELEKSIDPERRWSSPGFLAGWVASKIRVGEGDDAWNALNANWDFESDEGEEVCLTGEDIADCSRRNRAVLNFPERLALFLRQAGYMT